MRQAGLTALLHAQHSTAQHRRKDRDADVAWYRSIHRQTEADPDEGQGMACARGSGSGSQHTYICRIGTNKTQNPKLNDASSHGRNNSTEKPTPHFDPKILPEIGTLLAEQHDDRAAIMHVLLLALPCVARSGRSKGGKKAGGRGPHCSCGSAFPRMIADGRVRIE